MTMYYHQQVYAHMMNDNFLGELTGPSVYHQQVTSEQGDQTIRMMLAVQGSDIIQAKALVHGCGFTIAAASFAAQYLTGKSIAAAQQLTSDDIIIALHLSEDKIGSALLAEDAAKGVLAVVCPI